MSPEIPAKQVSSNIETVLKPIKVALLVLELVMYAALAVMLHGLL